MSEDYSYWEQRKKDDTRLDWRNNGGDWISEYWESRKHPHRTMVLDALEKFRPFKNILEIGCSCGPNLANIKDRFPRVKVAGIDANPDVIKRAKDYIPDGDFVAGTFFHLPWEDNSFDIVLADAVLMYADKDDIYPALLEMNRIARRGVVLVEWYSESMPATLTRGNLSLMLARFGPQEHPISRIFLNGLNFSSASRTIVR